MPYTTRCKRRDMPDLTAPQEAALTALGWLLDQRTESRGQGRSTILAIALIRSALAQPGTPVHVRELSPADTRVADRALARLIASFLERDADLAGRYRRDLLLSAVRNPVLRFDPNIRGQRDWLPPDWRPSTEPAPTLSNDVIDAMLYALRAAPMPPGAGGIGGMPSVLPQVGPRQTTPPVSPPAAKPAPEPAASLWDHLEGD